MTLFLLLNSCVDREFIYSIDSIRSCHLIFIDDFKVHSDSVFADDLWISRDIEFLPIPCVSHDSIFAIDLMHQSWIQWRCRFRTPAITQYSLTISMSIATLFSQMIYGSLVTYHFWQFHASAMTLFLQSIWCVSRELIDVVDSIHYLSLSIQWRFQGLHRLSFCSWFVDQSWHRVFDNSMRQPWHHFCYRFVASVVNSLTLWIWHISCHSVLGDDFKVYTDSVFRWRFINKPWHRVFDNSMRQPLL